MTHKDSPFERFDTRIAHYLADALSSMRMFWICTAYCAVVFVLDPPHTLRELTNFLSSNWFQLVALPVIGISGGIQIMRLVRYLRDHFREIHKRLDRIEGMLGKGGFWG